MREFTEHTEVMWKTGQVKAAQGEDEALPSLWGQGPHSCLVKGLNTTPKAKSPY